jgi:MFS family permease
MSIGSKQQQYIVFILKAAIASFITYLCMYAYRKPFTAAAFDGISFMGIDYKILLIISQLIGYTLSKYLGIKIISELKHTNRTKMLIGLMVTAMFMLLLFALVPAPYNFPFMFLNGIPLGMIWGVVFGYLEGRRATELLGAIMASSFIISSGIVKGSGKFLLDNYHVSDMWMPFLTALLFTPVLLVGVYLLHKLSPPTGEDISERTERIPMTGLERKMFIRKFGISIVVTVFIYVVLTMFRDLRDNFAVEFWQELSANNIPSLLITSELPVAFAVLLVISLMIFIKNNRFAFYFNLLLVMLSGLLMIIFTTLYFNQSISALSWMILSGFALYLPYLIYHTVLYERWIAFFKFKSNAGFLMYLSDAFGYLGSTTILLIKNFATPDISWVNFLTYSSLCLGGLLFSLSLFLFFYFKKKSPKLAI